MYNLVIAGGGTKAYSSIGAIRVLEERGIVFKKFIGVSAGSIIVSLLALGCNSYLVQSLYDDIDLSKYKLKYNMNTYFKIFNKKGIFDIADFRDNVIGKLLDKACGDSEITFNDIYLKYNNILVIPGTCINKSETHYYHYISNGNMKIKQAIAISCCVPFLFTPVNWEGDLIVDGGVIENYPLYFFNDAELPNSKNERILQQKTVSEMTIGIKFSDNFIVEPNGSLFNYIKSLVYVFLTNNEKKYIREEYWSKTIMIDVGDIESITDFNLSVEQKNKMLIAGYSSAKSFLL